MVLHTPFQGDHGCNASVISNGVDGFVKPIAATRQANWPGDLRPRGGLPSQSRMSRRLRTVGVLELIDRVEHLSRQRLPRSDVQMVDGRPLVVGGNSKDRDAQKGYAAGQWQRGYKLRMFCNRKGVVNAWHVTPMRHNEPKAASLMLDHTPPGGWVLADGMDDCNALYEQAAEPTRRYHPLATGSSGL